MKLLLVHANDEARQTLASAFPEDLVVEAASGGEALRVQRLCGELQVAIIHGGLADMAGHDVAVGLRETQPGLPIVALGWSSVGSKSNSSLPRSSELPGDATVEALLSAMDRLCSLTIPVDLSEPSRREALHLAFPYSPPPSEAGGLVIVADPGGKVVFLNRAARRLFQTEHAEGFSLSELSADWAAPFPDGPRQSQVELRVADGSRVPACQTYSTVVDHRQGARTVIAARPLATHCPRRGEVLASENRFRILLDELHVGVVVQDKDDRILISNPRACELLGITPDQLYGKSSFDPDWNVIREDGKPFKPEEHPSVVAMATKEPVREVAMGVYRPKTRDRLWILVTAEPVLAENGDCECVIVTFSDITSYKSLKDTLGRAHRLQSIGTLAAGLAHDFNNVLGTIMTAGESLQMSATSDEARAAAEDIFMAAERGAALTRKLLTFGREHEGEPERIVVDQVIFELAPLLKRVLTPNIDLQLRLESEKSSVFIDQTELERALLNLVVNARDVQSEGGRVTIETRRSSAAPGQPPHVEIAVSDEGPGISAEIRHKIFEPMFSTKGSEGTGLGLATVYGAVTGAGGSVDFETSSQGTTFRLHLPVTAEPSRAPEPTLGRATRPTP